MKKCKHKHPTDRNLYYEEGYVVECDTYCADCGEHLGHWAYGNYDMEYTLKYELKGIKKLFFYIKNLIDDIKFKIKYRKFNKNNDLPF